MKLDRFSFLFTQKKKILVVFSSFLALFWVVFLWNFWEGFIYRAFGFNATFFLLGFLALFFYAKHGKIFPQKSDLFWFVPIFLVSLSFSLYENPFLKTVSFFTLPIVVFFFIAFSLLQQRHNKKDWEWSFSFFSKMIILNFAFILKSFQAVKEFFGQWKLLQDQSVQKSTEKKENQNKDYLNTKKRARLRDIVLGVFLFLVIAFLIIIPLLNASDPLFAQHFEGIFQYLEDIFSWRYFKRLFFFIPFAIFLISLALSWIDEKRFWIFSFRSVVGVVSRPQKEERNSVVYGIIIGGIFLLYLLFIFVQVKRFWIGELPIDFKETEELVKSGFWQLFILSLINIFFFFLSYKRTNGLTQKILALFTLASLFLVFSAGQRMFLYVWYYGFSYEKFFAFYTVIYCVVLFIWLIGALFSKQKKDIFKFLVVLGIWMYGIVSVLPIEKFIFQMNVKLKQVEGENSRIKMEELVMLSSDIYLDVKKYRDDKAWVCHWKNWLLDGLKPLVNKEEKKHWFEKNWSNVILENRLDIQEEFKRLDDQKLQEECYCAYDIDIRCQFDGAEGSWDCPSPSCSK